MTNILVLTTYPSLDASRRLRIDPLVCALQEKGHNVRVHELLNSRAFSGKNASRAQRALSATVLLSRLLQRLFVLTLPYEILIVHREASPFFTPLIERFAARRRHTLSVLDVDDAIYAQPTHAKDWRRWLRNPARALEFGQVFDVVLCGNPNLEAAFSGRRAEVVNAPTCPPMAVWNISGKYSEPVNVLWTGSQSTLASLREVLPGVLKACEDEGATLHVLGGENIHELPAHPRLIAEKWSEARELELLSRAAIGLMPLPNTDWERGKSGYKAILYICAGMRVLLSPVGINGDLAERYTNVRRCAPGMWRGELVKMIKEVKDLDRDTTMRSNAAREFDARVNAERLTNLILSRASNFNQD